MRIFLGTQDTASCLSALAEGFRQNGCTTTTMVSRRHPFTPDVDYDFVRGLELLRLVDYESAPKLVRGVAWRVDAALGLAVNGVLSPRYLDHDVFVFIVEPWAPAPVLYQLLNRLGKKVVVYYLGSDVRHASAFEQEFGVDLHALGRARLVDPLETKVRRIRWGELYADLVYSVPDQAGLQIRPYNHAFVPVAIPLEATFPGRREPVVVHAPSKTDVKGTSFVLDAVDRLKREGHRFEFKFLQGVPRATVLETLQSADILVDELLFHGPGVLSAEAMSLGCAVATRSIEPAFPCFTAPVRAVRPDTVHDELRRLIVDVPARLELAHAGHDWARRTFDAARIAKNILADLAQHRPCDYRPDFYLRQYRPPKALSGYARRLSTTVASRFRQEERALFADAARRGLLAWSGPDARVGA